MKCPYCDGSISKESMLLYFINNDATKALSDVESDISTAISTHNSNNNPYVRYWEYRKIKVEGENGFVLDLNKLKEIKNKTNGIIKGEVMLKEQPAFRYSFNLDEPKDSSIWFTGKKSFSPVSYLCPHCWNFFPKNYFDNDNYVILLIGPTEVGKTAFTASLLANGCARIFGWIPNDQERLSGKFNDIKWEKLQRKSAEAIQRFTDPPHVLPPETENAIPPVFLTFTLRRPNKVDYTFNVSLVDTKGEGWTQEDGQATAFLNSCDGVLYFVEPAQSSYIIAKHDNTDNECANNDAINSNPQAGYESQGNVVDIGFKKDKCGSEKKTSSKKKKISADKIFIQHFMHEETKIQKDTPIALVLTKFDQIIEDEKYSLPEGCNPVFFDQLKTFSNPVTRNTLIDYSALMTHNVAAINLFTALFPGFRINPGNYPNVNYFCTSSFTGTPTVYRDTDSQDSDTNSQESGTKSQGGKQSKDGIQTLTQNQYDMPYNIHLPFLWLLSQILDIDGSKRAKQQETQNEAAKPRPSTHRKPETNKQMDAMDDLVTVARDVYNVIDDD